MPNHKDSATEARIEQLLLARVSLQRALTAGRDIDLETSLSCLQSAAFHLNMAYLPFDNAEPGHEACSHACMNSTLDVFDNVALFATR